ncbi:alpha-ketoglutarate-dependent dioxygenase AlkB [Croceicoccus ponticola]|uniref:Alpha-ketoglutarate-dependent dioxygenase AlkB n=2 Tax=Croceicoccus ponticola TaxID=2217664 RepID=A0A437H286_9SPHN|nr:alpha-ketoglutarate-dependent dioxygenase AlkB [Croceicoccus ponticola]
MQFDLFAPDHDDLSVAGLAVSEPLFATSETRQLCEAIDGSDLSPFRFQQWTGKRMTCSFGWHYDFAGGCIVRAEPMPAWLLEIRDRAIDAFGDDPGDYEQGMLIRYDPGAGIGWHRDRPQFGRIVGVSLGAPATMRLRRRNVQGFDRASFALDPGAAYRLDGVARREWEHSIVPMELTRWSITFRTLETKAVALPLAQGDPSR